MYYNSLIQEVTDFRNWDYKYTPTKSLTLEIKRLGKLELKIVIVTKLEEILKQKQEELLPTY
jgi:hypothetical protein